jgi:hypothetical protein
VDEANGGAAPLSQGFWDELLAGKAQWGLRVYEQDWLGTEFQEKVRRMTTDATLGRQWLRQMGEGAAKNGLTVQVGGWVHFKNSGVK